MDSEYKRKEDVVDQFRHVNGTPRVLTNLEETVDGAVRHIYDQILRAAKEIEDLRAEVKRLRALCRQNGVKVSPAVKKAKHT